MLVADEGSGTIRRVSYKKLAAELHFSFSKAGGGGLMPDVAKKSQHRGPRGICSSCQKAASDIDLNRLRTNTRTTIATAAMTVFALMSGTALSAQSATEPGKVLRGKAAFGDWREDAPGVRRLITLADLPEIGPEVPSLAELTPKPADCASRKSRNF